MELQIDTPNPAMGTGSAVLADGQDVAMLRATIVDAKGNRVFGSANNVTFSIVSGPGRVLATHNGDQGNHEPNHASWHSAFHGLVRGIIQVTTDASSPAWLRSRTPEIDAEGGKRTQILDPASASASAVAAAAAADPIVVQADSPGLTSATITIPVSVLAADGVLAVAYASTTF